MLAVSAMHLARSKSDTDADRLKIEAQARFMSIQPVLHNASHSSAPHNLKEAESLIAACLLTCEFEILKGASHHNIGKT